MTQNNPLDKLKDHYVKFRAKLKKMRKEREEMQLPNPPRRGEKDGDHVTVEVSGLTVARSTAIVLVLILAFNFVNQISGILVLLFTAFLFAAALDPIIDLLQKRHVPRSLGMIIIYVALFIVVGLVISSLIQPIADQIKDIASKVNEILQNLLNPQNNNFPFAQQLRPYIEKFYQTIDVNTAASQIQGALQALYTQLINFSFGLMNVLLVLILTFFMTVEEKAVEDFFLSLFPSRYSQYISSRIEAVKGKIGYWLRGQLLLSFIAGLLTYIGLLIMGVDYALTHSLIAAILMVIPVVGRGFAWAVSFLLVFNQSPWLSLWFSIYYFVLQQIENNVLVPYIMNRAVGLSPIIIIIAMLIGQQFLGIPGLIMAIPLATTIAIFVKDYTEKAK